MPVNPHTLGNSPKLEKGVRIKPRMSPSPRTVRDPIPPNAARSRFWRGALTGAVVAVLIGGLVYLLSQGMITDALQGMEGSEISVPSGPASIPRNDAMISVRTIPSGADISVDFQPVGKTPLIDRTIGLGSHVITVRMDGFATFDTLITVGSGEEHEFSLTLRESRRLHELALEPEEPVTAEPAAVAAAPPQAAAEPQDPTPRRHAK